MSEANLAAAPVPTRMERCSWFDNVGTFGPKATTPHEVGEGLAAEQKWLLEPKRELL